MANTERNTKKVMVAMSGGVDSTVTAILLKEQGYDVVGVTFRLWTPDETIDLPAGSCCSVDDVGEARQVCHTLGIPHYVFNYKELFEESVIKPFIEEYRQGRTPNPCIACNQHIKFGDFIRRAKQLEFDYVATGHYGQVFYDQVGERYRLKRSAVKDKDQSYVLYHFTQEQLAATLMPLGKYSKEEVREIAMEHGFAFASTKPDSQDICFVPDGNYADFLEEYTGKPGNPGNFIDSTGKILGQHKGIEQYTIGQRRGLGISLGLPAFVTEIHPKNNTVTLGSNDDLLTTTLQADTLNWIDFDFLAEPMAMDARIRYAHQPAPAMVYPLPDGKVQVVFQQPQRAITAGQAVVFYQDDFVVGGGTIR